MTIGSAEVRAVFSSGSGRVAGCMINEGKVVKGCGIQVIRRGKVVHVGLLDSLKRVKEIVKEVLFYSLHNSIGHFVELIENAKREAT